MIMCILFASKPILFWKHEKNIWFYKQIWRSTSIIHFHSINHLRTNFDLKQTSNILDLFSLNYRTDLKKVLKDLAHWKSLCFSWAFRTNVIKMNISARFNYLSQVLLIMTPLSFFKSWQKIVWNNSYSQASIIWLQ